MQSLLNINDYLVEELQVRANPECKKGKEDKGEITTSLGFKRKGKELLFTVQMKIELNKSEKAFSVAPYYIYLDITGFFSFAEGTDEETVKKMIGLNGPAILYGVARGVVAQATANFRYGKFVLPTINFVETMREEAQKNKTSARRKKGS